MSTPAVPPPQRTATRRLTVRYTFALATIAVLGIAGQIFVQLSIAQLSRDTHVIQVASLQHTLSERISKDALAVRDTSDPIQQVMQINDLRLAVSQWEHTHSALQHGDATMGLPGQNSPEITRLFQQIAIDYNSMQDAAVNILVTFDGQPPVQLPGQLSLATLLSPYVNEILAAEPAFVVGMDAIVAQYQVEADDRVLRLRILEWTLLAVELLVIAVLAAVVFRPATRYVSESIKELVQAREREHELAALKDQFIIDANHELRTPIMALYNNLEILQGIGERTSTEQRARLLQRALASGEAVLRLLNSVLDTSALEGKAPRLELNEVAIEPLVRAVLETFDPREIGELMLADGQLDARAVTIHAHADLTVWADEGRLRQILINLITNALKYSGPGTPIEITASAYLPPRRERRHARNEGASEAHARLIQISVRDRGLGIPTREMHTLFNRFVRLERDIAGSVRGTGVGLYMCRLLVEAMGGRIWVESSGIPGEGSTFSFLLPSVSQVRAATAGRPAEVTAPSRYAAG